MIAFVTIETLNFWVRFARSYYFSCAIGAKRINGTRVTFGEIPDHTTFAALAFAVKISKRKPVLPPYSWRDEPTWRNPSILLRLFVSGDASNLSELNRAFGVATSVFDQLPKARNFFAHRNFQTKLEVDKLARSLGMRTPQHPMDLPQELV